MLERHVVRHLLRIRSVSEHLAIAKIVMRDKF
jgi:hypothetical protein